MAGQTARTQSVGSSPKWGIVWITMVGTVSGLSTAASPGPHNCALVSGVVAVIAVSGGVSVTSSLSTYWDEEFATTTNTGRWVLSALTSSMTNRWHPGPSLIKGACAIRSANGQLAFAVTARS